MILYLRKPQYYWIFDAKCDIIFKRLTEDLVKRHKWKKHKIRLDSENTSLISIVMEDPLSKKAFVGHSGLLIDKGGYFLFVEKLAFEQPYQVTKLKTFNQLTELLSSREEYSSGDNEEPAVICINDNVIGRIGKNR